MKKILPKDLNQAEEYINTSILTSLKNSNFKYLSVNLLFSNLRLNPIIKRLANYLNSNELSFYLIWADEGGAALAKRDMDDYKEKIFSFRSFKTKLNSLSNEPLLICISPQPYDFDEFRDICEIYSGRVLMFNGKLEDIAIGIGNVGRERRKEFIALWNTIFWLQPINKGAVMKTYGNDWFLFKRELDGYRFSNNFINKPNEDEIIESLQV